MVNKCLTKGTPLFMGVKSQKVTFLASFGAIVSFETSEKPVLVDPDECFLDRVSAWCCLHSFGEQVVCTENRCLSVDN